MSERAIRSDGVDVGSVTLTGSSVAIGRLP